MHYGPTAFSKNGLPTMQPKDPSELFGVIVLLSSIDIREIRKFYECK